MRSWLLLFLFCPTWLHADDALMVDGPGQRSLHNPKTAVELNLYQDNFRLIDHRGRAQLLTAYADKDAIFIVAVDPGCRWNTEILQTVEHKINSLTNHNNVQVLYLYSSEPQDREMIGAKVSGQTSNPVLMDYSQLVTSGFGLKKAGDYIRIDPKGWRITERGSVFAEPFNTGSSLKGWFYKWAACPLPQKDFAQLTYAENMAPVFFKQCVLCHMQAPYTDIFHNYQDIANWLAMNKQVLRLYRMPPSGVDYYANSAHCVQTLDGSDGAIDETNLAKIQNWLAQGAPKGDMHGPDPLVELRESFWTKRQEFKEKVKEPDLIWEMKSAQRIPAEGSFKYMQTQVAGPLAKDLYVRGVYLDTNANVTRHVNIFVLDHPLSQEKLLTSSLDGKTKVIDPKRRSDAMLEASDVGSEERVVKTFPRVIGYHFFPKGTALFFPKGSYVVFQFHYIPTGKVEHNRAKLSLFLDRSDPPPKTVHSFYFKRKPFELQPGQAEFALTRTLPITQDITLFHLYAHGHLRHIANRFDVEFPDGKKETICNVPFYQYKHQHFSTLQKPMFIPAGSKIHLEMDYDNSFRNPSYPDISKPVSNGVLGVDDEMDVARIFYVQGKIE